MSLNGSKALYQPWREDEFSGDDDVLALRPLQRWMYRALLAKAFAGTHRPYLPADDDKLWRLAGCENKKQWLRNKPEILQMFSKTSQNGLDLLSQKRVVLDWERETARRSLLSAKGREGGLSQAKARVKGGSSTEQNRTNRTEQTEHNPTELTSPESGQEEDMNKSELKKQISTICLATLGQEPERHKEAWDRLDLLAAQGGNAVVRAFQGWAEANRGDQFFGRPLGAFLKTAVQDLAAPLEGGQNDHQLNDLCATLYEIGDVAFAGRNRYGLSLLLAEYPEVEIVDAYKEYVKGLDGGSKPYAPKNFAEGAGVSVILGRRKRDKKNAEMAELGDSIGVASQARAAQELADLTARELAAKTEADEEL